jgi:hypothetical protein
VIVVLQAAVVAIGVGAGTVVGVGVGDALETGCAEVVVSVVCADAVPPQTISKLIRKRLPLISRRGRMRQGGCSFM